MQVNVGDIYYIYDKGNFYQEKAEYASLKQIKMDDKTFRDFGDATILRSREYYYYHSSLFKSFEDFKTKYIENLERKNYNQALIKERVKSINETIEINNSKIDKRFQQEIKIKKVW